jgi:hypothetical protein
MKKNTKRLAGLGVVALAGAVFGPLEAVWAGHSNAVLTAELNGRNEVPAEGTRSNRIVGDPNGRGEAYVFGIDGDPTTLCYVLTVDKIEPATAAHIHRGAKGTNGPVVANLGAPADGNAADCLTEGEVGPGTTRKFPTGISVQEILSNPEDFYVNVHNAKFPGGAIRGQLAPERDIPQP